jgi:hypothetical protein
MSYGTIASMYGNFTSPHQRQLIDSMEQQKALERARDLQASRYGARLNNYSRKGVPVSMAEEATIRSIVAAQQENKAANLTQQQKFSAITSGRTMMQDLNTNRKFVGQEECQDCQEGKTDYTILIIAAVLVIGALIALANR